MFWDCCLLVLGSSVEAGVVRLSAPSPEVDGADLGSRAVFRESITRLFKDLDLEAPARASRSGGSLLLL